MDQETLARAAEPFFTTKGVGKGTGLGLAMVQGLAAQSGGVLRLKSSVGVGTEVELWLPAASRHSVAAAVDGVAAVWRAFEAADDPGGRGRPAYPAQPRRDARRPGP